MANTITEQVLVDNSEVAIVHVFISGEAAGTDETNKVIIDSTDANKYTGGVWSTGRIMEVSGVLTGFDGVLLWDATTPVPVIKLNNDNAFHFCFEEYGGIKNNAGTGITGKILLTTNGLTAATDKGHITIKLRKH